MPSSRREYAQVLRLLKTFAIADFQTAVEQGIDFDAIGFDAVKHLLLRRGECAVISPAGTWEWKPA